MPKLACCLLTFRRCALAEIDVVRCAECGLNITPRGRPLSLGRLPLPPGVLRSQASGEHSQDDLASASSIRASRIRGQIAPPSWSSKLNQGRCPEDDDGRARVLLVDLLEQPGTRASLAHALSACHHKRVALKSTGPLRQYRVYTLPPDRSRLPAVRSPSTSSGRRKSAAPPGTSTSRAGWTSGTESVLWSARTPTPSSPTRPTSS